MFQFQPRYTSRLLRNVGTLERLQGRMDRHFAQSEPSRTSGMSPTAAQMCSDSIVLAAGADAIAELEPIQTLPSRSTSLGQSSPGSSVQSLITAHTLSWELSLENLRVLHAFASGLPVAHSVAERYRTEQSGFHLPDGANDNAYDNGRESAIFPVVAPYLISSRIHEIVAWTEDEIASDRQPPAVIGATYLLLFLQCSPFAQANHRVGLLSLWHILVSTYPFLRVSHFAPELCRKRSQYRESLRIAERSALTSWSTMNVFLEFFSGVLADTAESAATSLESRESGLRLTKVQKMIVDAVRADGPATRDQIAGQTGIAVSTIKYNLGVLAERGVLLRRGGGRSTSYTVG